MDHEPDCDVSSPPIKEHIEKQGFYVCNFLAGDYCPAFSYTVGMRESQGHPEFIAMGLSLELNSHLVVEACERVKAGETIEPDREYTGFIEGYPIRFVKVLQEHMPNHFGYAREYFGGWDFEVLQIVWPDKQGLWPWNEGCIEAFPYIQKLLDRDPHFAFYAPKNLASFVSEGVFDENMVIYDAIHGEDGWQFIANQPTTPENLILVCLETVVKEDPTINELFTLPQGKRAWRKKRGGEWTIEDYVEPEE